MKKNVGLLDRFFRLGVGFLSLSIAFISKDPFLFILFGIVAVLGMGTGILGYCPINDKFGLDTRKKKEDKKNSSS